MIAVVADDFTGAAELAGISLRYGLKVELYTGEVVANDADVLIVSTDSRSLKKEAALETTADVLKQIIALNPVFIYKKIDSVLRGYVLDELNVQMQLSGKLKAIVLPANPSLGRTINNGEYFIDDKRITETGFVHDPEFPVNSSFIKEMLNDDRIKVLKYSDFLPDQGIIIGEATTIDHMKRWASITDQSFVLAGAGDFFTAILNSRYAVRLQEKVVLQLPYLYVCGTAFNERKKFISRINEELGCVCYMPDEINEEWLTKTCSIIKEKGKAVLAIDESNISALELRTTMAKAVKQIVEREHVKELFIEGGSTAAAILEECKIRQLSPVNELQRGVVRMKAHDLLITVKPGSYELPEEIKRLFTI